MKKKKKAVTLLLAAALAVQLLAGCGAKEAAGTDSEEKKTNQEEKAPETAAASADTQNGEPVHLVVTYLYQTATPADLVKVQEKVNEITIPAINVEVEFKPLGFGDSFTNYSLWISSGETVDLMMIAFQDIKNYVNSGQIESLDAYISEEKTPALYQLMEEFPITTQVQGEIYGITPVGVNYGEKAGLIIRKEYFEETGAEEKDIYTMEELTAIFKSIKEKHPDCYPLGVRGNDIQPGNSNFSILVGGDYLGGNVLAGALLNKDSETVVNLFETQEYKDYLAQLAAWYEAGYIVPDAATTDTTGNEMLVNGKTGSYPMSQKPEQFMIDYGFEVIGLPTGKGRIGAISNATNWTVPITSTNPEAAVTFLNYLYENQELSNLITGGIEGEHFNIVDAQNGVIEFANGYDALTSPYYNLLGFWGDRRYEYTFSAGITRKEHEAYTQECMENKFKSYGFKFDSSAMSNEMIACQSVLDQYQKALETGSLGKDFEKTYDTMVSQLKNAGIDAVVAECQKQFDAYLGK